MMFGDGSKDMTEEMQEYREKQKEAELRLLGTMLFQSVLLAFCIMLYVNWSWSHFNTAYESAIFYGFAGFSVQAAFYFIYRAVFEDSSDHRRQLKRMRNKNRQRMAHLKFEQEKAQLEAVLGQQMSIYQNNLGAAMADNVITPPRVRGVGGKLGRNPATYGTNTTASATSTTASASPTVSASNSRITGDRPTQDNGNTSWTEADLRPILAEIIRRLDSIEFSTTGHTRPDSSSRGSRPRTSRREPPVRCGATTLEGKTCTRRVKGGGLCWQHR